MFEVQVTIVGGGILGCAVADAVSARGFSVVLLEQEAGLARGTTSRNSEVSHGGMYYPAGSLKAVHCVRGRRLLQQFCAQAKVGYRECGKLIVAAEPSQQPELERLHDLGLANGVEDLRLLDGGEVASLEPQVRGHAGLLSPRTAILDAEGATRAYARRAEENGAQILVGARATALRVSAGLWEVGVSPGDRGLREGWRHASRCVVNAAGLWADRVAALAGIEAQDRGWSLHLSKGNYFRIDSRHDGRVQRLIYPVPPADGSSLGVHLCLDLAGRMKLGPDVQVPPADPRAAVIGCGLNANLDYSVDPGRRDAFHAGVRPYLPWLEPQDLTPDTSGLRPKLAMAGFRDFVVSREEGALAGLINLVGIDSPGLTSAPSLALAVTDLVAEVLR